MWRWLSSKLFGSPSRALVDAHRGWWQSLRRGEDRSWEINAGQAWYDQPIARPYVVGPETPLGATGQPPSGAGLADPDKAYQGYLRAEGVARFVTARCGNCAGCRNGMARCVVRDGRAYIDNHPYAPPRE